MAERLKQLPVTLEEFRKILDRREKAALDFARRAPTPGFGQASRDEAAFFGGLRTLLNELEIARIELSGNSAQPFGNSPANTLPSADYSDLMTLPLPSDSRKLLDDIHALLNVNNGLSPAV